MCGERGGRRETERGEGKEGGKERRGGGEEGGSFSISSFGEAVVNTWNSVIMLTFQGM